MFDKLSESTQAAGRFMQILGLVLCVAALAVPAIAYGHHQQGSSFSHSDFEVLVGVSIIGFIVALIAIAGGYDLMALSAILDHLSDS